MQSNALFAQLALAYDMHVTALPPFPVIPSFAALGHGLVKSLGDCFEAQVGALAAEGRHRDIEQWLTPLFEALMDDIEPLVRARVQREDEAAMREIAAVRQRRAEVAGDGGEGLLLLLLALLPFAYLLTLRPFLMLTFSPARS